MDICEKFGRNVYKYRTERNLSQEELAELTDLHRTYISAVERGTRSISSKNIQRISDALKIPTYKLFDFGGNTNE